jgi:hypothetical protein
MPVAGLTDAPFVVICVIRLAMLLVNSQPARAISGEGKWKYKEATVPDIGLRPPNCFLNDHR